MQQVIAIFDSARDVIRAEELCRKNSIKVIVMPVPENLSSECGMSLKIEQSDVEQLQTIARQANINVTIHNHER